jgi:hypothetical protein
MRRRRIHVSHLCERGQRGSDMRRRIHASHLCECERGQSLLGLGFSEQL